MPYCSKYENSKIQGNKTILEYDKKGKKIILLEIIYWLSGNYSKVATLYKF